MYIHRNKGTDASLCSWLGFNCLALYLVNFRTHFYRKRRMRLRKQTYHVRFEVLVHETVECAPTLFGHVLCYVVLCRAPAIQASSWICLRGLTVKQSKKLHLLSLWRKHLGMKWDGLEFVHVNVWNERLWANCSRSHWHSQYSASGVTRFVVGHLSAAVQRIEYVLIMRHELCILTTVSWVRQGQRIWLKLILIAYW